MSVSNASVSTAEEDGAPLPSFDLTPAPKPEPKRERVSSSPPPPLPPPPPRRASTSSSPAPPSSSAGPVVTPSQSAMPAPAPVPTNLEDERVLAGFARLSAYVNTRSRGLPGTLRARLAGLPRGKLALGALGVVVLLGGAVFALRSRRSTTESAAAAQATAQLSPSPAPAATDAAPAAAAGKPESSAGNNEATILLDQADKALDAGRYGEVIPLLDRLIARQPELKNDARLTRILLKTTAVGDAKAAVDGFALLKGPMGEVGAALAYELSLMSDANVAIKKRAELWLKSKEFERVSPLHVYTAVKLRNAKTCEDKHALLSLAGNTGGKYVAQYLRELDKKSVCSPDALDDCFPCMRNDNKLKQALEKAESP